MTDREYYNCVFPISRPNVWVVKNAITDEVIGEVNAQSETEARIAVCRQIMIPFTLSHIEE